MKTVCQLDDAGYYLGPAEAFPSPLEPGVYILPGGAVDAAPPAAIPAGQRARWKEASGTWTFEALPDPPTLSPEQLRARLIATAQAALDGFAQSRGYDGILSACSYVASTVARFAAEADAAIAARDATWRACYAIEAAITAGTRPLPTLEEAAAELPPLTWPVDIPALETPL